MREEVFAALRWLRAQIQKLKIYILQVNIYKMCTRFDLSAGEDYTRGAAELSEVKSAPSWEMKKVIDYYYTGYYKFFKFWQSDDDSARNAKAMISLVVVLLWLGIFGKLYNAFVSGQALYLGRDYKPLGYLLTLPIIFLIMKKIKSSYPNEVRRDLIRAIIVTLTIPIALLLMTILLN